MKMTERLVKNWPASLLHQMVARANVGQEEAAILLRTRQAAPVTIQKFLEMRCCLTKSLEKN